MPEETWKPHEKHGRLTTQSDLPDSVYAFPKQRKEPMTDAQQKCAGGCSGSIKSPTSRMLTALWRSPTSKRLQTTTASAFSETSRRLGIHPQKSN